MSKKKSFFQKKANELHQSNGKARHKNDGKIDVYLVEKGVKTK